ncbi:putative pyrazinamidase/nicotinamidase [Trypanosoma grayi]|uniref:putative pyrazinamidase/nicotinamidase n=1 Tax=Trypanosoma grayi TaxID=71804 RepID=UPI0004F4046B|nr:putative pyrazinamidase/nicotinamidase [Trypanosoma grayi]KEG05379.1 putative pyrazinamidase/nicotinamidase [Trypanosoma grayi]
MDTAADSYSAFIDDSGTTTGLTALLRALGVRRVFVCGLAYDFCVYFTALDALKEKFDVVVLEDATRAVFPQNMEERRSHLQREGVTLMESGALGGDDGATAAPQAV